MGHPNSRLIQDNFRNKHPGNDGSLEILNPSCGFLLFGWTSFSEQPLPGNSQDMNPIKNLWAMIKHKLCQRNCRPKAEMIAAFQDIWENDQDLVAMCNNLIDSVPDRIQDLIANKAGHTKYK